MLQSKNTLSIAKIAHSSVFKDSKNYLSAAFSSACTITPFDVEKTKFTFFPPIALLGIISNLASILAIYKIFENLNLQQLLIAVFLFNFLILAYFIVIAFLFSYFGCKILGFEYSSCHFGIITSSFIPLPLLKASIAGIE